MVNKIERRDRNIENIRSNFLEYFYDEKREYLPDSRSMQTLGLNMYVNKTNFKQLLYNGFSKSHYDSDIIMHPQQIECLNYLLKQDNLLISAPTSFGKTYIALEYISRRTFNNVVFVVPTLALMNELFLKIKRNFGEYYNIVQNGYENVSEKNIFIIVPERADIEMLEKIIDIDFLVFDEIYKLQRNQSDKNADKRIISLNRGYFELVERSKQILLLGPFIKDISFERTKLNDNITKYISDFSPVYTKINFVDDRDEFVFDEIEKEQSKLIYFSTPNSIYNFAVSLIKEIDVDEEENSLTQWCDKYITEKWLPSELLKKGIGIHHGKLPNFMRRYIENLYNAKEIKTILCTSTLLEGINTPTSELIVYDSEDLSAFRLNNLIGRVGRLNSFQKGQVYLFDRDLEKYLIGDEKYEEISIVAEKGDITDLEEVLYLNKSIEDLDEENLSLLKKLEENLSAYNRTVEDLKKTNGFILSELMKLFEKLPQIINKAREYRDTDKALQYKVRNEIVEILLKIIKYSRHYTVIEINNSLQPGKRIKHSVCVSKLLNLKPDSIYKRIQKEVKAHQGDMAEDKLNLFIDYLFDLAFSYIKYDLTRMVGYFDFIFNEAYLENREEVKINIEIIEELFLKRLRIYCCDNNILLKILVDLDFPYQDAKVISGMLTNIDEGKLSTSVVMDMMEMKFEEIMQNKRIDNVTKDLLKVLLKK